MIRRTFFHFLTGLAIPLPRWHPELSESSAKSAAGTISKPASPVPANDPPDPEWLKEWLHLPRLPVLSDDLPQIMEPQERELATQILQRIHSGSPIDFHYFGGSEPGKHRRVLPVQLFTTAPDGMTSGVGTPNPIYLLAWCQLRNAPRTFSLNRMERKQDQSKSTTCTDILD